MPETMAICTGEIPTLILQESVDMFMKMYPAITLIFRCCKVQSFNFQLSINCRFQLFSFGANCINVLAFDDIKHQHCSEVWLSGSDSTCYLFCAVGKSVVLIEARNHLPFFSNCDPICFWRWCPKFTEFSKSIGSARRYKKGRPKRGHVFCPFSYRKSYENCQNLPNLERPSVLMRKSECTPEKRIWTS